MKIQSSFLTIFLLQVSTVTAAMQGGYLRQANEEQAAVVKFPSTTTQKQSHYIHHHEDRRRTVQQTPSQQQDKHSSDRQLQYYGGSYGDCSGDNMYVQVDLITDWYGNETTWEIVRDVDGAIVQSGYGFQNGQQTGTSFCLPKNCYTFTIRDSNGDGICCDYGLGKYNVTTGTFNEATYEYTMDTAVISGGAFASSESASFGGECQPLPEYTKTKCVNLTVSMTTGEDPWGTYFSLYDLNPSAMSVGMNYWTDYAELPNQEYTFTKCINPTTCYELGMSSYYLEGINATDVTVTYDGAAVELSGDTNYYSALIGEACAGRPPCVDLSFSLYTEETQYDLQISFNDYFSGNYQSFYDQPEQLYELEKCVDPLRCYEISLWSCYNDTEYSTTCSTIMSDVEDVLIYNGTTLATNFSYYYSYYVGEGCSALGYSNNNYW